MQEEIENKTVNLAISTTKLSGRLVMNTGLKAISTINRKMKEKGEVIGKQTLKQLIGQKQGVTNIDIDQTDLKGFERYARKYGVDYAITKDKSTTPAKYLVFFKAKDGDAMTAAFKAYSAEILNRKKQPSVLHKLHTLIDKVKELPVHVRKQEKERNQVR